MTQLSQSKSSVLGVRDVITFSNVAGAGFGSSSTSNSTSQEKSHIPSPALDDASSSSAYSEKESRCMRKKRKTPLTPDAETVSWKFDEVVSKIIECIESVNAS